MKKIFVFILTVFLLGINAFAVDGISVFIDDKKIDFEVKPQLIGGRTMVPLRTIFEELGAVVLWEQETQTVTAYNEAKFVKATINSNVMYVNGAEKTMDIAPMIVDNRTLVPARFVAEAFDCDVLWDADDMAVYITSPTIDYSELEQEYSVDEEETEYIDYYYCEVPFPKYDSIINAAYLEIYETNDAIIHVYDYTTMDDYEYYISYLVNNKGWAVNDYEFKEDIGVYVTYLTKYEYMIGVTADFKCDEICIVIVK